MTKRVFNMGGGAHSDAAYTAFENAAYGSCVANATSLAVSGGGGMSVRIAAGDGIISTPSSGKRIQSDAIETVTISAANATYSRIDSVVAYIDSAVQPTTAVIDNVNGILKFAAVAGTPAADPKAPAESMIQAAIGAGNRYMVLADVKVPNGATSMNTATFTDRRKVATMIDGNNIAKKAVKAENIDFTTMPVAGLIATKTDNTANSKQPLNIQCGCARILIPVQQPQPVEAIVEVQFPEIFKGDIKPVVLCTFSGYTGNAADRWTDSPIPDWAGAAIAAVGATNSSFKARIRRFDGATLLGAYYFNWIAIG